MECNKKRRKDWTRTESIHYQSDQIPGTALDHNHRFHKHLAEIINWDYQQVMNAVMWICFYYIKIEQLTVSPSISSGDSNLSKQCPDIVQTRSSLEGSITISLHVSSHTGEKKKDVNIYTGHHIQPYKRIFSNICLFYRSFKKINFFIGPCTNRCRVNTMNMSCLLTYVYISNHVVRTCYAWTSVIWCQFVSETFTAPPQIYLIRNCLI